MLSIPYPGTHSTIKIGGTYAYLGKSVELKINGAVRFIGNVTTRPPEYRYGGGGWILTYQCIGQEDRANYFPHTDQNDLTDSSSYNAIQDTNPNEFALTRAGRTVGQILTDVLTMDANAAALSAAGLMAYVTLTPPTLPGTTVADLAALTIIPQGPIRFGGEKFYAALESFCSVHAPHHNPNIDGTGQFRLKDMRAYTAQTVTLNTDPVRISGVSFDVSECYSRVVVRGEPVAKMANLTLSAGGLNETPFAHDGLTVSQAKTAWSPDDYQRPGFPAGQATGFPTISGGALTSVLVGNAGYGYTSAPGVTVVGGGGSGATVTATITGDKVTSFTVTAGGSGYTSTPAIVVASKLGTSSDAGTCTCPSTTTVVCTSADKGLAYTANFWDQTHKQGTMFLWYSAGAGITQFDQQPVVSNTAMSPGGTATFTLAAPLQITAYDSYFVTGLAKSSAAVWCLYGVTDSTIASRMTTLSTYPFGYHLSDTPGITLTSTPVGAVLWSSTGLPPYQEWVVPIAVDPVGKTIRFAYPTYLLAGSHVPTDVRALVPVNVGQNQVASPPDVGGIPQYSGTSNAYINNRSKTLTVMLRGWRDPLNASYVQAYADELLDSVKDVHAEATLTWMGFKEDVLTPGVSVNIAGNGYTTAWESLSLPVVQTQLEWNADSLAMVTTMQLSNRRAHLSAEAFLHPGRTGMHYDFGGAAFGGFTPTETAVTGLQTSVGPQWDGGIVTWEGGGNGIGTAANQQFGSTGRVIPIKSDATSNALAAAKNPGLDIG